MDPIQANLQAQINDLASCLASLSRDFYADNFSARQEFSKYSNFKTRLKVPHYALLPATCDVGELVEVAGILYVGSAINTWTKVGTQT